MRTTLDLDEKILGEVKKVTGARSKSKAVAQAMEEFLRGQKIKALVSLAGTMPDFMKDFDYKAARALDIKGR